MHIGFLSYFCLALILSASDDVYIVLFSIKLQQGRTKRHFCKAMENVIVPVTMTSIVNLSMFAILNISVRHVGAFYLVTYVSRFS
jgi:hypothetical protein